MSSGVASYVTTRDLDQEAVVTQYANFVKRIAYHLLARLPPCVQIDDLIQSGMMGLLEAARNYDPMLKASFETYAGIRIRGAMLDEIRRYDWAPRSVHRKARQIAEAIHRIEAHVGRDAHDQEIAAFLELSPEEYHQTLQEACGYRVFSFEELAQDEDDAGISFDVPDHAPGPLEQLEESDFRACLAEAIAGLPEREKLILSLYYDEELNLKEIGAVLKVSESRVSQLHSQAMIRLRARLHDWAHKN